MNLLLAIIMFVPLCFFAFTIPGIYFLSYLKIPISKLEEVLIGTTVGLILFTLISYLFLLLNVPIIIIGIIIGINILARQTTYNLLKSFRTNYKVTKVQGILITFVFCIGIIGQLAIIAPSGSTHEGDIVFWSAHGFDGTWHLALMEELKKGGPFQNPTFAGFRLVNYHFFSDVAPAVFYKYLPIPHLDLYFKLFPILYSILLGGVAFVLTKRMTKSLSASIWATFFTYFAGSFGYIVTYLKDRAIGGESIFWATQVQSASGNPPQIISDILVLTYLFFTFLYIQKKSWRLITFAAIILGTLTMFKVYAAVVLLGATLTVGLWQIIRERKIQFLILSVIGGLLGAILYFPNVSGSTSFLIFQPWWFIRTLIVEPSRLNWLDLELRRQTYVYEHNTKRVIFIETISFLIFLFGNLGMRFLGLFDFGIMLKKIFNNYFNMLFILVIFISLVFPLLFLQKGVAGNTSQFLQYFILLFGLLAGLSTSRLVDGVKPKFLKIFIAVIIVVLSVPTQVGLIKELYSRGPYTKIDQDEIEALTFIRKNMKGVILTPPNDPNFNLAYYTPDIWDWSDTAYVAALSGLRTYFDAKEQADIMGYDFGNRLETKNEIFKNPISQVVKDKINLTKADIVYFPKLLKPKVDLSGIGLTKAFENYSVEVWKTNIN